MKCSKFIAVLLIGVMMFGVVPSAQAETVGYYVGGFVSLVCDIFAESIAVAAYGDPSLALSIEAGGEAAGEKVGEFVDWVISWFE